MNGEDEHDQQRSADHGTLKELADRRVSQACQPCRRRKVLVECLTLKSTLMVKVTDHLAV